MPLSTEQFKQLQRTLMAAFPTKPDLEQMVRLELGEFLSFLVGGDTLRDIVYQLITWAESRSRVLELVNAAEKANPDNAELRVCAGQLRQQLTHSSVAVMSDFHQPLNPSTTHKPTPNSNVLLGKLATEVQPVETSVPPRRSKDYRRKTVDQFVLSSDNSDTAKTFKAILPKAESVRMCGWSLIHIVDGCRQQLRVLAKKEPIFGF